MGQVAQQIEKKITETFSPAHYEILNESGMHSVPPGSESHFKVIIISNAFEKLNLLARQRLVYACLQEEIKNQIHALSLVLHTEKEWADKGGTFTPSPLCASKK